MYFNRKIDYDREINNINIIEKDSIKKSINKVYDSVVVIESYSMNGQSSIGSGFIYKVDNKYGYILTNYHVVKNSDSLVVINSRDNEQMAKLLGFDEQTDLAILRIEKKNIIQVAKLYTGNNINIGDTVFTIGSPWGKKYQGTITKGIVSGLNREVEVNVDGHEYIMSVIQTDAAINPGNSGGPLVNINGEVIGINSLKIVKDEIEGMGFAIPIEEVLIYTDRLEKGKKIDRPYLGFELTDTNKGVLIRNIKLDSIKSELHIGDIIRSIDGVDIGDKVHFRYVLYKHIKGDIIPLTYIRNNKLYKTTIKI